MPRRKRLALDAVRRRLELTLAAIYGRRIPIAMPPEQQLTWMQRLGHRFTAEAREERTSGIDGGEIRLPIELRADDGPDVALGHYRLLALEQAERLVRGTATMAPADPLERDLFLVREGAAIDATLARANPGMRSALQAERAAALAKRPRLESMSGAERTVETLLRQSLAGELAQDSANVHTTPEESLAWARAAAEPLRTNPEVAKRGYRGVPAVPLWGSILRGDTGELTRRDEREQMPVEAQVWQVGSSGARKTGTGGSTGEESEDSRLDGKGRAELMDLPLATDGFGPVPRDADTENLPAGIAYPEWDAYQERYLRDAAIVRPGRTSERDDGWAKDTLREHAALVRTIRHQFEKLRALPARLDRQLAGDEIDVASCIAAIVDRRTGNSPSERLYIDSRPARRGVAIALLVDTSASTSKKIGGKEAIIDIEKVALLVAAEAFDALGDLYTILTFSGTTSQDVRVATLKAFGERNGERIQRRITAISAAGYTRLGAAVRHATALLARQHAGHRLLLILSDGRPNDVDAYMGSYGVEDSRRAILEARESGVHAHCITIDQEGSEYLPRIFGQAGHTILRRPSQLPFALLRVVKQLLRSAA
jgi:nitric oxide reductase NorD protein